MAQRLVRAKRKIADWRASPTACRPTTCCPTACSGVLAVVYLIFNEGYGASGGERLVRGELCSEAIRLGRLLARLMPDEAEVHGLLALMLLHDSRRAARVDERGRYVPLDEQDRAQWDEGRIREGLRALETALALRRPGRTSCRPRSPRCTPRRRRARRRTGRRSPSSTARSAGSRRRPSSSSTAPWPSRTPTGRRRGSSCSRRCSRIRRWSATSRSTPRRRSCCAARATREAAARAYERAIELSANAVERAQLERRLAGLPR